MYFLLQLKEGIRYQIERLVQSSICPEGSSDCCTEYTGMPPGRNAPCCRFQIFDPTEAHLLGFFCGR